MHDLQRTMHGRVRMQQRGYRDADINLILKLATPVADDAFILTNQDAAREIALRKNEIQQLERLRGSKVIFWNGQLITLYHDAAMPKRSKGRQCRRQK